MNAQHPIGIFDSGIGGLTVARALREVLPEESIVYFGDTAHVPYGDKSPDSIRHYSREISKFLLAQGCKMVVVACNTASARAFADVQQVCGKVPAVNVIDPVVDHVAARYAAGKVGIIGTKNTVQSRVYPRRLHKANPQLDVLSKATPLLAPMIEEGFFNQMISKTIIRSYLKHPRFAEMQALILGCTHYPLIEKEVSEVVGPEVEIINSARVVAQSIAQTLDAHKLRRSGVPEDTFYVSDYTDSFKAATRIFFGERISLQPSGIWGA